MKNLHGLSMFIELAGDIFMSIRLFDPTRSSVVFVVMDVDHSHHSLIDGSVQNQVCSRKSVNIVMVLQQHFFAAKRPFCLAEKQRVLLTGRDFAIIHAPKCLYILPL